MRFRSIEKTRDEEALVGRKSGGRESNWRHRVRLGNGCVQTVTFWCGMFGMFAVDAIKKAQKRQISIKRIRKNWTVFFRENGTIDSPFNCLKRGRANTKKNKFCANCFLFSFPLIKPAQKWMACFIDLLVLEISPVSERDKKWKEDEKNLFCSGDKAKCLAPY